ncbi:MAG: hypothetical protein KGJ36_02215 [Acidobacteriota bacterium]|nr:hypothetical protein [Acidobacteriota bacterium]
MSGRRIGPGVAVVTVLALVAPAAATATAPVVPATSLGFDISFPQCGHPYPTAPGFAIIGVNRGHAFSTNPCLDGELRWGRDSQRADQAFYLNTGAPGPGDPHWPRRQRVPQACRGANSIPCAYDYGWNSARASFDSALGLLLRRAVPSPLVVATSARWWLDVESANPWETWLAGFGPSRHSQLIDQAALRGSLGYLKSRGVAYVGIYSSVPMWRKLMGRTSSAFSAVPEWIPGSASLPEAQRNCATRPFAGGFVAMLQYPSRGYDGDYRCGLAPVTRSATSTVAASAGFRDQLALKSSDGRVTFTQASGAPSVAVGPSGVVTTSGPLARGTYRASGATADAGGDTGTFSVTLRVGIISQRAPTTAQVTVSASLTFTTQLVASGGVAPVAFTQTVGQPALRVDPTGLVTAGGGLAAGTYTASGTTSDAAGDTGSFRFTLVVGQLGQAPPISATVTSDQSAAFTVQLAVTGNVGAATFSQASGQPSLIVSSSGVVTTSGPLAPGSYRASGTTSDATGDAGTFTFLLKVTAPPPASTTTTSTTTTTTVTPG